MAESAKELDARGRVVIDGVTKRFGETVAVDDVSLAIERGEFLTLLGPSGCGKTTLLRMVAGFEEASRGRILLGGRDVTQDPPERRPVNLVFQRYALFPHLDVAGNVAYGLVARGMPRDRVSGQVASALDLVAMSEFSGREVQQLSGGQQQRVALARALVNQPEVLLLDEPLAALDLKLRKRMQVELRAIHRQLGTTFVYVTHDQGEALTMSDRVAVMDHGVIAQVGTPEEIYRSPRSRFVASFVGESSFVPCSVHEAHGDVRIVLPAGATRRVAARATSAGHRSGEAALLVRPEAVTVTAAGDGLLDGRIEDIMFTGAMTRCIVMLPGGVELKIDAARIDGLDVGDAVGVTWAEEHAVVLDRAA